MQSSFTALLKASVVIFCVGLSACDQAIGAAENAVGKKVTNGRFREPTIVMAPGWRMDDHGRQALIYGRSHCPDANGNNTSEDGCVVIDAHSAAVAVIVVDVSAQSVRKETWEIERKGERTIVKRPDNSHVIAWSKQ